MFLLKIKNLPAKFIAMLFLPLIVPILPFLFKDYVDKTADSIIHSQFSPQLQLVVNYPEILISYRKPEHIDLKQLEKSIDITPYREKIITEKKIKEPAPSYRITFIYIGINKRFVMINGKLYRENDRISKDERIKKIEKDRVLLTGKWGERWIKFSK
ncbi:hypothetical protein [Persephonella sp.]